MSAFVKLDDAADLGRRAWAAAGASTRHERAEAIARLVRAYVVAARPLAPRPTEPRGKLDTCPHCSTALLELELRSGIREVVNARPRRLLVLADEPFAFYADCFVPHGAGCARFRAELEGLTDDPRVPD